MSWRGKGLDLHYQARSSEGWEEMATPDIVGEELEAEEGGGDDRRSGGRTKRKGTKAVVGETVWRGK